MLETHQADGQPGVALLVGGILEDTQKLVRQEVALAQREVAQAWDRSKTAVALLTSALVVFGVADVLLGFMLAALLRQYLLPNHEWACFAIAGGLFAVFGGALLCCGIQQMSKVHVTLPQTVETLRQDVKALNGTLSAGRPSAV